MKYFLVTGEIHKRDYLGEVKTSQETRLVAAESEEQARQKFDDYFSNKTIEYSVYYSVGYIDVHDTIE